MTNSNYATLATTSNYPAGYMNTCQCGQVIKAPATIHDMCTLEGDKYGLKCMHTACGRGM